MLTPLILFLGLTVATAIIAYWSDNLGKKLGKKRVSLFGLRPRTTATILTISSSWIIMVVTLVAMLVVVKPLRNALFRYDRVRNEAREASQNLSKAQKQLSTSRQDLTNTRSSLVQIQAQAVNFRRAASASKKQAEEAQKNAESAVKRANEAQKRADAAQGRVRSAQARLSSAQARYNLAQNRFLAARQRADLALRREGAAREGQKEAERQAQEAEKLAQQAKGRLEATRQNLKKTRDDLKSAAEELKSKVEELRLANVSLASARESSKRATEGAFEATKRLLNLEIQLKAVNNELKAVNNELSEAQNQLIVLRAQREDLEQSVNYLLGYTAQLAKGDVEIPVGRTFAAGIIESGKSQSRIEENLRQLLEKGRLALSKPPFELPTDASLVLVPLTEYEGGEPRSILEGDAALKRLAAEIASNDEPTSVRVVAARNVPSIEIWDDAKLREGIRIDANIVAVRVATAFRSGEVIATQVVDGSSGDAGIFNKLQTLTDNGRVEALKRKVNPPQSPQEQFFYAAGTNVALFAALRSIEAAGKSVTVRLVAADDLSTVEPLRVRFEIDGELAQ